MSAREEIAWQLLGAAPDTKPDRFELADAILSALHAMPLPDRLALARALVPECAVVPREPTEAMVVAGEQEPLMSDAYRAMLAASEATP